MVKRGQILGPRPDVNRDGSPRKKPGKKIPRSDLRADRLVLRVHPDLQSILTLRARETGVSRSTYAERVLLGWANADPRNPKVDSIGKFDPRAPSPADAQRANNLRFAERWAKFAQLSEQLLGVPPKREWFEQDPADFWPPQTDEEIERADELAREEDFSESPTHNFTSLNPVRKTSNDDGE